MNQTTAASLAASNNLDEQQARTLAQPEIASRASLIYGKLFCSLYAIHRATLDKPTSVRVPFAKFDHSVVSSRQPVVE